MSSLTRLLWVLLALAPLTAANAQERQDKVLTDDWMSIYLNGQKVGHVNTRMVERDTEDGVVYVSTYTQQISLARGTTKVTIATTDTVVETKAGRLVAFESELDQGRVKQVTRGQVKDGRLVIRSNATGREIEQIVDVPLGLCPHAVRAISRVKGYEPGTKYSLPVFIAQAPTKHIVVSIVVGDTEAVEIFGVTKWLHREEAELSLLGLKIVNWVDDEGTVWLSRSDLALFKLEMRKVSKSVALELADDVEIMVAGAVVPDRPISSPRKLETLALLVSPTDPDKEIELPSGPNQKVKKVEGGLHVVIRRAHGDPAKSYPLPYADREHAELLKETPWLETGDELIARMSREAVGEESDALKAALRIEVYVSEQITEKTLSMGFATAAETARQRAGDCTEHAVLVAALARSAGMPSRIVCGLVYGGPVPPDTRRKFYYHMWAEVYVGEWLPLDAALGSHDATHIDVTRSALAHSGDLLEITAGILGIMGAIEIKVLDTRE